MRPDSMRLISRMSLIMPSRCFALVPIVLLAAMAAFELGRGICHYGFLAGSGLPAWTPDYDTSEVKPLVVKVADMVAAADGMVLFGDTAMSADPANIYLNYVSQVYSCAIDGAGFINGLAAELQ